MTSHDLARLLLLYPERVVCVRQDGMLREAERVRVTVSAYLPRVEDGLVARAQVIVVEGLEDQSGGCGVRSTVEPLLGPAP